MAVANNADQSLFSRNFLEKSLRLAYHRLANCRVATAVSKGITIGLVARPALDNASATLFEVVIAIAPIGVLMAAS